MQALTGNPPPISPEQLKLSRTFDFNLEALRGFAAIMVVWHHVIEHKYWLDPHYRPSGVLAFNPSGHLSVLVFFVLSGYVIGRVHIIPLERKDILPYLKKRFTRIYPIYVISIIIALLAARTSYPTTTVISNLTMTQNSLAPVIFENNPAWSLSFEIIFYLAFIPLSFFRFNIAFTALALTAIGLFANTQQHYNAAGYALGLAFWLCGVLIARSAQRPQPPNFSLMASMLLLLLTLREFNSLDNWLYELALLVIKPNVYASGPVQIADLSNLPYCLLFIAVFISRNFNYKKYLLPLLLFIPLFSLRKRLHHIDLAQHLDIILPLCFYASAILIYFFQGRLENHCKKFIKALSKTGGLSYGLYMIHFPILTIFSRIGWFSGTAATFYIRFALYIMLCFTAAYFLEKKLQPRVKQLLTT